MFIFNITAIILGAVAVAVYYSGVRREKRGALAAFTVLVIAAVAAAALPYSPLGRSLRERRAEQTRHMRQTRRKYHYVERLGEKLADELDEGDPVLILFKPPEPEWLTDATHLALAELLEAGAGFELNTHAERVVPESGARPPDARAFDAAIEPYRDYNIKLVVSFAALPIGEKASGNYGYVLEDLECFTWEESPMFIADFQQAYNAARLREYIQDNLLRAVSVQPIMGPGEGKTHLLVDEGNLDEL